MLIFLVGMGWSQMSHGGTPVGLIQDLSSPETTDLPALDMDRLLAEDDAQPNRIPYRYAEEIPVSLGITNSGEWISLEDGSSLWRLGIRLENALSLSLHFNRYLLPTGAELFIYSPDFEHVSGAFTDANNKAEGMFATAPISSNELVLEYRVRGLSDGELHISAIMAGYRGFTSTDEDRSGWCNNNVACPEGDDWENEINSVVKLFVGPYLCSGAMINNTDQDGTPYLLTAYHCVEGSGNPNYFTVMFNFQASQCYGTWGPTNQTLNGTIIRASSGDIYNSPDFCLLELTDDIPEAYGAYYSGWTRSTDNPYHPVGIHHPDGDIKKISFDFDTAYSYNYYKWNVIWDDGVTEPGSSGSPLFDNNHRIVGDLSTGCSDCDDQQCPDQYGKVYQSWDYGQTPATRLSDWLDPSGSDVEFMDGMDPFNQSGITLGDINEDEIINVQDIIVLVNIIMGNIEPDEYQQIAGDINEDTIINIQDIVLVVNIILGTDPNRSSGTPSGSLKLKDGALWIEHSELIAGIQLEVQGDFRIISGTAPAGWQIEANNHRVVIYNSTGNILEDGRIFQYSGSLSIQSGILADWSGSATSAAISPSQFLLLQAQPNPFNPLTALHYIIDYPGQVQLAVFDLNGRQVTSLVNEIQAEGCYSVQWNAGNEASGIYLARLTTERGQVTHKILLLK